MNTRQRINRKNPEKIASHDIFRVKFARYVAGGIQTRDLSLARTPLYHCTTLSLVSRFRFWFPTYYTKLSVNYLFEALNEFKPKGCQL
jgi:hypothetical protein